MKVFYLFLCSAILILLTTNCKKEEEPVISSPASKLRGKVVLMNKYGQTELTDRAGTQVVLMSLYQTPTQTDNSGRFEFSGLSDGNYTLTVSREGYVPYVMHNIGFSQNYPNYPVTGDYQILPTIKLGMKSVSRFDSTHVYAVYNIQETFDTINGIPLYQIDTLSADLHFSSRRIYPESYNPNAKFGYRIFIGNAANIGPSDNNNNKATYHGVTHQLETEIEKVWTQQEWQSIGLNFNDPIFIKVYGDAVESYTTTSVNSQTLFPLLSDSLGVDSTIVLSFQ